MLLYVAAHLCKKGVEEETKTYLTVTGGVWKEGQDTEDKEGEGVPLCSSDLTDMALFHTTNHLLRSTRWWEVEK